MTTYTASITRGGRWWMIHVPEVDGLTQARHLADAERMARELVAVSLGVGVDDVTIATRVVVEGEDVGAAVDEVRQIREAVEQLQALAAQRSAELARRLNARGVPLRDVAAALGVSYQRAHQLVS
jgi:glycine cleavage system aminomethyltransferase T